MRVRAGAQVVVVGKVDRAPAGEEKLQVSFVRLCPIHCDPFWFRATKCMLCRYLVLAGGARESQSRARARKYRSRELATWQLL